MTLKNTAWAACAAATLASGIAPALAQPPRTALRPGVTFSAEVTVTQAIVDRTGKTTRELPSSRYRLERRAGGRMTMTMLATRTSPASGPLADPYAGITVDTDPATGGIRIHDVAGALVTPPAPGQSSMDSGPSAARPSAAAAFPVPEDDGLIVAATDRSRRLDALGARFGRPVGKVRALQRYLARRGTVVEEALVAADTGLTMELNLVENGALVEHHAFEYVPVAGGRLVRGRTRSESALPGGSGGRVVALTTLSDIRVDDGGGR